MKKITVLTIAVIIAAVLISCSKDSPTVVNPVANTYVAQFQQGVLPSSAYNGINDTHITNAAGKTDHSFATCDTISLGRQTTNVYRIAISCAMNSIPSSAKVTKAFLTLTGQTMDTTGLTATAYAQSDYWFQGSNGCDILYTNPMDGRWNGPWTAGGSLVNPMSNSAFISYNAPNRQLTLELDTTTVQNWVKYGVSSYPDANNGLVIKASDEVAGGYAAFISSDNSIYLMYRPIFTIYYQL